MGQTGVNFRYHFNRIRNIYSCCIYYIGFPGQIHQSIVQIDEESFNFARIWMLIQISKQLTKTSIQFNFSGQAIVSFVIQCREEAFEFVLHRKSIQIHLIYGWLTFGLSNSPTGIHFKHFSNHIHTSFISYCNKASLMHMKEM